MLRLFRLVGRLPLHWLQAIGRRLGRLIYRLSSEYRRKLDANLVRAGYSPDRIGPAAAAEAGRMVGELPYVWFRPLREVVARVVCDEQQVLERAEQAGRGILFLTPHLGAFEVTARFYALRAPITVLFKPPRKGLLAPVLAAARNVQGLRSAPANFGGLRSLLRSLKAGEAIGLLPDQVPTDGDGQWTEFFGTPAYTMTLPQKLVELTGAAVVLAVGERLADGQGWRLHLRPMTEAPTPLALNRAMEALIRDFPAQYLWGYNRYKRPPGIAPP